MGVAYDGRRLRRRREQDLAPQRDAVERLEDQWLGFDRHRRDGTVVVVVAADDAKLPIKMLNDRLLVKIPREDGERRSSGGILIPATAQVAKRLVWAEVVGVGQNVRTVQVGDQVLFSPDDRYEVEVRGEDFLILRERDIHAVAAERVEGSTGLYL
jgi:chaperonin GroES